MRVENKSLDDFILLTGGGYFDPEIIAEIPFYSRITWSLVVHHFLKSVN